MKGWACPSQPRETFSHSTRLPATTVNVAFGIIISHGSPKGMMDYGLSTCICLGMPLERAIAILSEQGIAKVEYAALNLVMSSTDDRLRGQYISKRDASLLRKDDLPIRDISEAASSHGIIPVQIHSPDYDLGHPDKKGRKLAVAETCILLDICSDLGAGYLIIHPMVSDPSGKQGAEGAVERVLESIGILARRASDLGVKLALENTWKDIYGSRAGDLLEAVESTDPDSVCICLDTGHSQRMGIPPADMVRRMGRHIKATHIHDYDGHSDHIPPFSGAIDWYDLVSALSEIGYGNTLIGEIEGSQDIQTGANRLLLSKMAMEKLLESFNPPARNG